MTDERIETINYLLGLGLMVLGWVFRGFPISKPFERSKVRMGAFRGPLPYYNYVVF
jgi:hypothetical protein